MYRHRHTVFFGMILFLYTINMTIDIMELDAAQYAAISREMWETGHYLQVYHRGQDYLDKPPLLFWLSSLSIGVIGNTNVAYKLPSILLLLAALWATYKYTRIWYDHSTGLTAALLLGSTQAFQLMTNDARTDGLLTSFVILSVWFLSLFLKKGQTKYLLLGGACIGGAMLAKGPIGLFIPAAAIGGHLILSGQWKKIVDPSWLWVLIPVVVVIAPMCYGLYMQFDLHPEKEVYGFKGPSGLGFYFWTQSFGRITGENYWDNNAPWYFFIQTLLWDLQPWVLLFLAALAVLVGQKFQSNPSEGRPPEWISFSGFLLPLIALSFSGYKLPHYIFPLFPFAAVMIAAFLRRKEKPIPGWLEYGQLGIIHLLCIASLLCMLWVFPVKNGWLPALWMALYIWMWVWRKKAKNSRDRVLNSTFMGAWIFQFVLSIHFYPNLLRYQSSSQAGKYISAHKSKNVYWYDKYGYALDYYSNRSMPTVYGPPVDTLSAGSWVYVTDKSLASMPPHKILREFDDFPVTNLSLGFLNPQQRDGKVHKMYLIEMTQVFH